MIPAPPSGGWGVSPYLLHFRQPAGTSRGTYTSRKVWFITYKEQIIGECAPLPNLSCDDIPEYEEILSGICNQLNRGEKISTESLRPYPSILCGFEMAMRYMEQGSFSLWDTPFSRGEKGITINGLIWMGSYSYMHEQIIAKLDAGFHCIKLKIGAIQFDEELALIRQIRKNFSAGDIQIRVDANGAFTPEQALDKLQKLADLDIHSIEQPIRAGQWDAMRQLVEKSPLPIALDEELIGINDLKIKNNLLDSISPHYIILKPSLHGGFSGSEEWITKAQERGIHWWITSALESNIGLNAIAQWCATFPNPLPQGLGTGALFTNNIPMPLQIRKDSLWYNI